MAMLSNLHLIFNQNILWHSNVGHCVSSTQWAVLTASCCYYCCVAFAQISGWLIRWSSGCLIFIINFNVYNFYYPLCPNLQCVHIFVLENAFVVVFFICPGDSSHSSTMRWWVSGEWLQYRNVMLFWKFYFVHFTGSIDVLVSMVALHSFLLSFSMYSSLLLIIWFSLFSHQCFVLVLYSASSWVLFLVISVICLLMFICFNFEHFVIRSFTLNSSLSPLFWCFFIQVLLLCCLIFLISVFSSCWSVCGPAWLFSFRWYLLSRDTRFRWGEWWLGFLVRGKGLF